VACSRVRAAASHSVLIEYLKNYRRPLARLIHTKRPPQTASRKASCVQHFKAKTAEAGVVRARPPHKKAGKIFKK